MLESSGPPDRPDFMAVLGLLPPYALSDVKMAYRVKVREAHPDRGGEVADFIKLEEAYRRAIEYVNFESGRREWIANRVEFHLRQEEIVAEVGRLGGQVEFEQIEWLKGVVGDGFALLADRLRVIRLRGLAAGDTFLAHLAEEPARAPYLAELDLSGSKVTDRGLAKLAGCETLKRLNLAGTAVTDRGLWPLLRALPWLEWINVAGSGIGWWSRWRLRWAHPRVKIVTVP
jgi:hypothetical protein